MIRSGLVFGRVNIETRPVPTRKFRVSNDVGQTLRSSAAESIGRNLGYLGQVGRFDRPEISHSGRSGGPAPWNRTCFERYRDGAVSDVEPVDMHMGLIPTCIGRPRDWLVIFRLSRYNAGGWGWEHVPHPHCIGRAVHLLRIHIMTRYKIN